MNTLSPHVVIVDDDESVRKSLPDLLKTIGYDVDTFSSAEDFLDSDTIGKTECLVLDLSMPGMTGLQLHLELARRGHCIPTVFITAQKNDTVRNCLIAHGAVDCLYKPFNAAELQNALNSALGEIGLGL